MTAAASATLRVFPQHCGVNRNLRVRHDLPGDARAQARASGTFVLLRRDRITLYMGEIAASKTPVILDTLLGSCVAVCIYDPKLRAGGMNHILLPSCRAGEQSPRCGIHAMELLINEVMKLGGDRRRFVAKAFGGANVLPGVNVPAVGEKNAAFVRRFLALEKIPLVAQRLGGTHAVHLFFRTDTGKATVHTVDGSMLPKIAAQEQNYQFAPAGSQQFGGEITLF